MRTLVALLIPMFLTIFVFPQSARKSLIQYNNGYEMFTEHSDAQFDINNDTLYITFKSRGIRRHIVSPIYIIEEFHDRMVFKMENSSVLRLYNENNKVIYTSESTPFRNMHNLLIIADSVPLFRRDTMPY